MITTPPADLRGHYDVVVVGSGAAGLVTAARAAEAGLSVLVLEKGERLGGTSAVGGGVMWAPCNHLMEKAGQPDSREAAARYLRAATEGRMTDSEIEWYVTTSAAAVRYLDERTDVRLTPLARPDYHPEWDGAATGRGLDNEPFDPGPHPGLAEALRRPTYLPLISMNERDALKGAPVDQDLLAERRRSGVRTMGGALVGRLVVTVLRHGVTLAASARVTGLDRGSDGRWTVTLRKGEARVTAARVVLASGGFEWNPQLRAAYLPFPVTPISAPTNEGDGLLLGLAAGAAVAEMTAVWGVPVITAPTQRYDGLPSGRMGNVELTLPGSVMVNAQGLRFVNEATNYHDLNRAFGNTDPRSGRRANAPAWLVFDRVYLDKYAVAGSTPGVPEEWMVSAETVAGLARACGIEPAGLHRTLQSFNADARTGDDTEFGRGASEQDRHLGDPVNTPNPCLAPVEKAPFYAVPVHAGVLGTAGGLRTDLDGRVLNVHGEPIGGLYAAGNCSATVFHDAYPGGGATLGSAVTRGFTVGGHLAATAST
ncbi:FAD-dependent oxidoreductase [Streptomyces sp. NBC_01166]|uniref:FAD-dependent oxidoreductase n=1 Tax=Streptomyces sp. NBC_01166 TaxID=2903755 RepID=UPI0038631311|nr:FAD-dependent oxidoreductase [Streptomyces sp. NBC_01166]